MIESTDEDLMLLVREGDRGAFDLLVQRHRRSTLNFVYRFLGDREAAEDLSQEVFVRLWSCSPGYVPSAKLTTFLYHIARNLCRDYLDKTRRHPHVVSLLEERGDGEGHSRRLEEEIRDPRGSPHRELASRQTEAEIETALGALPEDQRLVFVLTELQGCSYETAAQIAGCPVGTVASRKSAAIRALRKKLSPVA